LAGFDEIEGKHEGPGDNQHDLSRIHFDPRRLQLDSDEDRYLVDLVCFVYPVDLVHLISFVQPNKQNEPNKRDRLGPTRKTR
jgi:hypothetical protein